MWGGWAIPIKLIIGFGDLRNVLYKSIYLALFCMGTLPTSAQAPSSGTEKIDTFIDNPTDGAANIVGLSRLVSSYEFWLSVCVLALAVFVILIQYRLVMRRTVEFDADTIVRMTLSNL